MFINKGIQKESGMKFLITKYTFRIVVSLDLIHRSVFYNEATMFRLLALFLSSGKTVRKKELILIPGQLSRTYRLQRNNTKM
jgi:hypothetical protein